MVKVKNVKKWSPCHRGWAVWGQEGLLQIAAGRRWSPNIPLSGEVQGAMPNGWGST